MKGAPDKNLPTSPIPATQALRLEVLRLAYRHDKDEQTIIDRCNRLEAWVLTGRKAGATGAD